MREPVRVREVGPRDGLQLVKTMLPTERKIEFCRRAMAAGLREIEVTSFVPPSVIPQFADAAEVAAGALQIPGIKSWALVPNLKGAERAIAAGFMNVAFVLSASEAHNQANVRKSTAESIADFSRIVALRNGLNDGSAVRIAGGIATCFGCAISGEVPKDRVLRIASELLARGADELVIADTVGYANPRQVGALFDDILALSQKTPVLAHFHDTYGLGLANVAAALGAGVRGFDSSIGGIGGCPFAPNATGNIDTENCVYLLESMGFDTGIDLESLIALRRIVEDWLPGEKFSGALARSGLPKTFVPRRAAAR